MLRDRAATTRWDRINLQHAFSDVQALISGCDYAIVNLESPVTDCGTPIVKDGPSLKNPISVFDVIKYCDFNVATLANNHLKDYGGQGVIDTIRSCKDHDFLHIGAGLCLADARCPLIFSKMDGVKVGLLNICEHESSIVTDSEAGANPLDFSYLYNDINNLKQQVDKVIVIIHGGCEHYQLPTPRMKRDYHLIVDFGADIIVNHHQHCYSGYEIYKGKPIFYGLGNFFFDNPRKRHDKWNEGLLLKLEITKDDIHFELLPYNQCDDYPVIRMREYDEVKNKIEGLNTIIADEKLLNEHFSQWVSSKKPLYPFLPYGNHYLRAMYNRGYLPDCISKQNKALIENVISCETHREILLHYLKCHLHKDTL